MIALVKVKDYVKTKALVVPVNVVQKDETGDFVYVRPKKATRTWCAKRK